MHVLSVLSCSCTVMTVGLQVEGTVMTSSAREAASTISNGSHSHYTITSPYKISHGYDVCTQKLKHTVEQNLVKNYGASIRLNNALRL